MGSPGIYAISDCRFQAHLSRSATLSITEAKAHKPIAADRAQARQQRFYI
jgi:hypothetical protein